jgi:F0F1-type ATP synthase beta subunit
VRGVAVAPFDAVPRGSTVLSSGQHANEPINKAALDRLVPLLAGQPSTHGSTAKLLETGIKVIDVLCPLVAGSTVVSLGPRCVCRHGRDRFAGQRGALNFVAERCRSG